MIRHLLTVSTGTLASRLLGFARDSLVAALLGTSVAADAFLVAFQFINVTRRMLAEGALNAALVPGYLRIRAAQGAVAAAAFAGCVLGSVSLILIVIAAIVTTLMPLVMTLLAPGLAGRDALELAVEDARLMMPYFAFVGPVTVMMGVLNAQGRFVLTAFSPVLFNLVMIAVLAVLLVWRHDPAFAGPVIAATVGIAGCLQMVVLIRRRPWRDGVASPIRISFDAEMRGFFRKGIPGTIANAGPQFLIVAGAIVASAAPAAVSWLYFANRLIELPLGMVGVAMGSVLVPELARALHSGDRAALMQAESRGLELAIGLALPATLGLMTLREPVIRLLFEHGAFTAADTEATAAALAILALGLPAHVLTKVLAPAFFARDDTRTPLVATLGGIAAAIAVAFVLDRPFGAAGVAGAISFGAWVCAAALAGRIALTFGFALDAIAQRRLPRIVLCALLMGGMLWIAESFVAPLAPAAGFTAQLTILGGLVAAGISFYGLLLDLFGIVSWSEAIGSLRGQEPRGN